MSDLCYNCLNCHFPAPCPIDLVQCEICYAFGHNYIFCHRSVHVRDPNYRYQSLCHNCDKWHLPIPCPVQDYKCSECSHLGHQEWFCPIKPHDRVEFLRNERNKQPKMPEPTNQHIPPGPLQVIPPQTISQMKFHAVQEAFGLINQGWSPPDVLHHFASAEAYQMRRMTEAQQHLADPLPSPHMAKTVQFTHQPAASGPVAGPAPQHVATDPNDPYARPARPPPGPAQLQTMQPNSPQTTQTTPALQAARALALTESMQSAAVVPTHPQQGVYEEMQRRFDQRELAQRVEPSVEPSQLALNPEQTQTEASNKEPPAMPGVEQELQQALKDDAQDTPGAELPGVVQSIENTPAEQPTKTGADKVLGPRCAKCIKSHKRCNHREVIENTAPEGSSAAQNPLAAADADASQPDDGVASPDYAADAESSTKKKAGAKRRRIA